MVDQVCCRYTLQPSSLVSTGNFTKRAECAAYVRRALEQKVIIEDEVPDFSECLCEIPSEEVILQYDNQLNPAPDSTPHTSAERKSNRIWV